MSTSASLRQYDLVQVQRVFLRLFDVSIVERASHQSPPLAYFGKNLPNFLYFSREENQCKGSETIFLGCFFI